MSSFRTRFFQRLIAIIIIMGITVSSFSQTSETFATGTYIINMGNPTGLTASNGGLKAYGLIYDILKNNYTPVKWVISSSKLKDGIDFSYNGVQYKGGTFIVPKQFITASVTAKFNSYLGAAGTLWNITTTSITVDVNYTLTSVPTWTLDAQNGSIAAGYFTNARIPATAYNWLLPSQLGACNDLFVMPHADPAWSTHGNLYNWNRTYKGSIWAACHAVSALENMYNPSNNAEQTNFLSSKAPTFGPNATGNYADNSLILWGKHNGGSIPYTHRLPNDPVAQYMGVSDLAQLNGSEQIYIPNDARGAAWLPTTKIIAYDPTQADVPVVKPDLSNAASVITYGRAFGNNNYGLVMYEAGHSHNKGTAGDLAAQRAFFNFSFLQTFDKVPTVVSINGLSAIMPVPPNSYSLSATISSPVGAGPFTYLWLTDQGSFSNPTSATPNYLPPAVSNSTPAVITLRVTDACGRTSFSSQPVTLIPGPRPPVANPDAANLDPGCDGATLHYNVLTNDSDPDGDPLTLTALTSGPNNGVASFVAGGTITYTPNDGFTGIDVITYQVCDNTARCATSTLTITVGDPNKIPTVVADAYTINEDNIGVFSVLSNDVQVGGYTGGALSVRAVVVNPLNGRVSVNTDNTITYIPNADYAGSDVFTYQVINASGYKARTTVTITITNDACDGSTYKSAPDLSGTITFTPSADSYLREDQTGRNYGNCNTIQIDRETNKNLRGLLKFDLTGSSQSFTGDAFPATGATINSAVLNMYLTAQQSNNSFQIDAHKVSATWDEGTLCDANGVSNWNVRTGTTNWTTSGGDFIAAESNTNVTNTTGGVGGTNKYIWSIPVMTQAWYNNSATNYGLLLKMNIEDNGGNEVKTFGSRTAASSGNYPQLAISWTKPGTCSAIPNRAPLANPDYGYTTNSITPLVISNVKTNDSDDGTINVISAVLISGPGSVGTVTTSGFTYTPAYGVLGTAIVEYTISDGTFTDVSRVTITVTNAPITVLNDNSSGNSGAVQNINVMANDSDPENQLGIITIISTPANGVAYVNNNGTPANYADDFITYTPNAGFSGTDNLTYQLCEALPVVGCPATPNCSTAPANVTITVVNQPPVAVNDNKSLLPCISTTFNLLTNDTDPENGILSVNSISALSIPAAGTLVNNNDGTVTFTPATGFLGVVTFTYTIIDDGVSPVVSAPATVSITVSAPSNTAPDAVNDTETLYMDESVFTNVRDNDTDPEGDQLRIPTITVNPVHGTAVVLANGLIEYTPATGYFGTDVLTYQVCDSSRIPATCAVAPPLCDIATITYTIEAPNQVLAVNDENSTWVDVPVSGGVLNNDIDPEGNYPIIFSGFKNPATGLLVTSGSITIGGVDANGNPVANAGTLNINTNGTYTFTPASGFTGVASVPYTIHDSGLPEASSTATLRITVSPLPAVSNSVIANNDENISYGSPVSDNVLLNDRDPQGNGFTVTTFKYDTNGDGTADATGTVGSSVSIAGINQDGKAFTNAGSLVLNSNGNYTFTPSPGFYGAVDVPYTICDNGSPVACQQAILHITVLPDKNGPGNDPPFGGDDFGYTTANVNATGSVITNDHDPNGNPFTVTPQTTNIPGVGTLTLLSNGNYTFAPATNYTGPAVFPYTLCDDQTPALCANAQLHLLVGPPLITLPVTGLKAYATLVQTTATINWSTEQEFNSAYFVVERSFDNRNFIATGANVLAAGNSNSKSAYQLQDDISNYIQHDVIYYRVKQVDIDGKAVYSNIVIVKLSNITSVTTWPNPFQSFININYNSDRGSSLTIRLTDMAGKNIRTSNQPVSKGVTQIVINNLESLSTGIYMIEIHDENTGSRTIRKFIKSN